MALRACVLLIYMAVREHEALTNTSLALPNCSHEPSTLPNTRLSAAGLLRGRCYCNLSIRVARLCPQKLSQIVWDLRVLEGRR